MTDYNGMRHKTWADIDLDALRRNYKAIADHASGSRVMCVVKADAYGHGARVCAPALYECGARLFAVSCIEEAAELSDAFLGRGQDGAQILILGYTPPENADILSRLDIRQTVFSPEYAKALSDEAVRCGCRVKVHFKLDTGMNRIGYDCIDPDAAADAILRAASYKGLEPEGLFTHFACADDDESGVGITEEQYGKYKAVESRLSAAGLHLLRHVCNSAALLRRPDLHLDAVRAGVILYGLYPWENYDGAKYGVPLEPVMTFRSIVSHLHRVRRGEHISYGYTYEAPRDITVATIPVGYADGFLRAFANGGHIYVNGASAPIIGRICMDQCMADVSDIDVSVGDEVVLFGGGDNDRIMALANAAHTINYELVCLIGKRVSRIYHG